MNLSQQQQQQEPQKQQQSSSSISPFRKLTTTKPIILLNHQKQKQSSFTHSNQLNQLNQLNQQQQQQQQQQQNKLLSLPTHLFNSKLKSKSKSINPQLDDDGNTLDQTSLHTAVSHLGSNYETAQSQNGHPPSGSRDAYANDCNSRLNRDIWPILPNRFVYPSSNLNDQFFYNSNSNTSPTQSLSRSRSRSNQDQITTSDWTTSLGIDLNPKIDHNTSSEQERLSSSQTPRSPSNQFKFNNKKLNHKLINKSHKRKSSVCKSCSVYGTYTSLARQEIEKERALLRKSSNHRSSLSFSLSSKSSPSPSPSGNWHHHHLNKLIIRKQQIIKPHQNEKRPNTGTSDTLTHSSASTNRLRKTPTSGFYPLSPSPQLTSKRIIKKRIIIKSRHESSNTTNSNSTKDFSGTYNTSTSNRTHQDRNDTSTFGGKLGVQLRYHNAIKNDDQKSNQDDDDPNRRIRSQSQSSPSNLSIQSNDQLQRFDDLGFEPHQPEAGPSNWRRDEEIEEQERIDRNRNRYQFLDSPDSNLNLSIGKRSRRKSPKRKQSQFLPSWEYQVTQQLLIQSQTQSPRTENLTPKSQPSSHYHSLKSALSFESIPRLSPSLTSFSNRMLSSPASMSASGSGPMSTPSRVGTMVSMFSEWSRARQTSPIVSGRRGSQQSESVQDHQSINLRNSTSKDLLSAKSSLNPLDLEFGSNYKETLISIKSESNEEIKLPKMLKISSKERLQQRSVSQLKRDIQQEYFNRNQPNDLTHHDQAGLLLNFLPSANSPSDRAFSPIPSLSPGLNSESDEEEEDDDHSSSHSWYDAADEVVILDALDPKETNTSTHLNPSSPILPSSKSVGFNLRHSQHLQPSKMTAVKPAVSAAIVFDTSNASQPLNLHLPSSLNQYQLLSSTPNLLPSNTIAYKPKSHKKTYSTPSINHFNLLIPMPVDRIKSHGIFDSNDDPNFLSGSPAQIKKVWKKTQGRMKRAISDPTALPTLVSEDGIFRNGSRKNLNQMRNDENRNKSRQEDGVQEKGKKCTGFEGWKFCVKDCDDEEDLKEELMDEKDLIELEQTQHQHQHQHQHQIRKKEVDKSGTLEKNASIEVEVEEIQRYQSHSSTSNSNSNSNSTTTTSTTMKNKRFHSLSLVPFNGWCFVFGFIFFPLWYIGSFYPKISSNSSPNPNPNPNPTEPRNSLNLIRSSFEADRFLQPNRGGGGGGPISGWPTRNTCHSSSSGSESYSFSFTEENRRPDFGNLGEFEMRTLGGFWNEIAPRSDIENALAFDGPIWAYERAVYTWRLRCRVLSVLFPLVMIPVLVISEVVAHRM